MAGWLQTEYNEPRQSRGRALCLSSQAVDGLVGLLHSKTPEQKIQLLQLALYDRLLAVQHVSKVCKLPVRTPYLVSRVGCIRLHRWLGTVVGSFIYLRPCSSRGVTTAASARHIADRQQSSSCTPHHCNGPHIVRCQVKGLCTPELCALFFYEKMSEAAGRWRIDLDDTFSATLLAALLESAAEDVVRD